MKKGYKAAIYIFCVLIASAAISAFVIFAANDAFALCKSGEERTFCLDTEASVSEVSKKLKDEGFICKSIGSGAQL